MRRRNSSVFIRVHPWLMIFFSAPNPEINKVILLFVTVALAGCTGHF